MADDVVIRIEGLWKRYGLPLPRFIRHGRQRVRSLVMGENAESAIRNSDDDGPWALRDINLEVRRGDTLGVIGRNGAGKSTLLKVLAGVTPGTRGGVDVRGRVFPMIELNAGIHPELTGRENVRLLGAIMGLSRREMDARIPEIEEFCELEEWFDRPTRTYSSGMLARLGFAVAFHVNADILLIDEVLAVGDMAFRQKCIEWLNACFRKDVTALIVSHRTYQIERLCNSAICLSRGELLHRGNAKEVCARYYATQADAILLRLRKNPGLNTEVHDGSHEIRIVGASLFDSLGNQTDRIARYSDLRVRLELQVSEYVESPHFSVIVVDTDMNPIAHVTTLGTVSRRPNFEPGSSYLECTLRNLQLVSGVYSLDIAVTDQLAVYRIEYITNVAQFQIVASPDDYSMPGGGYLPLPATWEFPNQDIGAARED